jgi:hypothetical protein
MLPQMLNVYSTISIYSVPFSLSSIVWKLLRLFSLCLFLQTAERWRSIISSCQSYSTSSGSTASITFRWTSLEKVRLLSDSWSNRSIWLHMDMFTYPSPNSACLRWGPRCAKAENRHIWSFYSFLAFPLQAWTGPWGSRSLRLQNF